MKLLGPGKVFTVPTDRGSDSLAVLMDDGVIICACPVQRKRGKCTHAEAILVGAMLQGRDDAAIGSQRARRTRKAKAVEVEVSAAPPGLDGGDGE